MNIKWEDGASGPVKHGGYFNAVYLEGKVYVGGGGDELSGAMGSCRIDVYTLATNSWRRSPIKSFYCYFAMKTLNDQLITAGGENEDYKTTNRICYLQGNKLKRYTRMTTPRRYAAAAGHQGILIVTGGLDNECSRLATTELFDSSTGGWFNTGQWYTAGELPFADCQLK